MLRYLAFHNEHDPKHAEKDDIESFSSHIKSDTYKVTSTLVTTMDSAIREIMNALEKASKTESFFMLQNFGSK